jgi:hypothetical protein
VKVAFSIGALAFEGDLPASIFHMNLIKNDIAIWSATSEIVAVFHTNAGHVTLHDTAYNTDNIATGNPYKNLISDVQKARREDRALRRDREGPRLGKRGPAVGHKDQHGCHGEIEAACPAGIREDHRVSSKNGLRDGR